MKEILYNKSEVVGALNRVDGFNPMELARVISKENQEDQLYLDVKYRKLWFRLVPIRKDHQPYCQLHRRHGIGRSKGISG